MSVHRNLIGLALLLSVILLQPRPAEAAAPATQPAAAPATQPSIPKMMRCTDKAVGVTFDRPAAWTKYDDAKNGNASVSYIEPSAHPKGQVYAHMQIYMQSAGGSESIDVTSPPNPGIIVDKVFKIDGVPARLTVHKMPAPISNAEMLNVEMAKGSRFYMLMITYPAAQRDSYLAMAEAICKSIKLQ